MTPMTQMKGIICREEAQKAQNYGFHAERNGIIDKRENAEETERDWVIRLEDR
jgi:hypothetical protein